MKLASLRSADQRDGELIIASKDLRRAVRASHIAPSLREALENWKKVEPALLQLAQDFANGSVKDVLNIRQEDLLSALPRTWLFADGSSFIQHIKLVRKARNAALPETLYTVPLMYQGESGCFLAPTEDIPQRDFSHGTDFEAEVGVITDFVPMGVSADEALKHIRLVVLINDVSLRGLIPDELAAGFGFFQSKPASALSPFAVTPDELGDAWKNGRVCLPLLVRYNGKVFGSAEAGEMHFHFGELIAHAAKTRNLMAGTLIGSGTVCNEDQAKGSSCLAERRTIETIETGKALTPFMSPGDSVEIEMRDRKGESIFGLISQRVVKAT